MRAADKNGDVKDKIVVGSPEELHEELRVFKSALSVKETEHTWEALDRAIKRFTAVTRGGACRFEHDYIAGLRDRDLSRAVIGCIATERTQLSASALIFISSTTRLGPAFSPLISVFLPTIVRLLGRTNKLYISRATACVLSIVRNTRLASVLPYFANGMDEKSVSYRKGCMQSVLCALGGDEDESLEFLVDCEVVERRFLPDVEKCIRMGARDKDLEIRAMAKRCWAIYGHNFPHLVAVFIAPLTPISRRNLELPAATLGASTTSVASSSLSRSQPVARPPQQQSTQTIKTTLHTSMASTRDDTLLHPIPPARHHSVVTKRQDVKRSPSKEVHTAVAKTKVLRRQQEMQSRPNAASDRQDIDSVTELHVTLPTQPVWRSFSQPNTRQADPLYRSEPQISIFGHQPSAQSTSAATDPSHAPPLASNSTQSARSSFRRPASRAAQPPMQGRTIKSKASRVFLPANSTSIQFLTEEAAAVPLPSSDSNRVVGNVVPLKRPASALSASQVERPLSSVSQVSVASSVSLKSDEDNIAKAEQRDDTLRDGQAASTTGTQSLLTPNVKPEDVAGIALAHLYCEDSPKTVNSEAAGSTARVIEPPLSATPQTLKASKSQYEASIEQAPVSVDPSLRSLSIVPPQSGALETAAPLVKASQPNLHSAAEAQQARRVPFRPQRPAVAHIPMTQTARRVLSALPPQSQKQPEYTTLLKTSQAASDAVLAQTLQSSEVPKPLMPATNGNNTQPKILTHKSSSMTLALAVAPLKPASNEANKRLKPGAKVRANMAQLRAQPSISELRAKPQAKAAGGIFARLAAPTASSSAKSRATVPRSASGSSVSSQSDARPIDKMTFKKPHNPAPSRSEESATSQKSMPAEEGVRRKSSKAALRSPIKEAWKPQPPEVHPLQSIPINNAESASAPMVPSAVDTAIETPFSPSAVDEIRPVQLTEAVLLASSTTEENIATPLTVGAPPEPATTTNSVPAPSTQKVSIVTSASPQAPALPPAQPATTHEDVICETLEKVCLAQQELPPSDNSIIPANLSQSATSENGTVIIPYAAAPFLAESLPTPLTVSNASPIDDSVLLKPKIFDTSGSQLMLQEEPTRRLSDGETILQAQLSLYDAPQSLAQANEQTSVLYELFGTPRRPFRPTVPRYAEANGSGSRSRSSKSSTGIPHSTGLNGLSQFALSQDSTPLHESSRPAIRSADEFKDHDRVAEEDDDVALLITRELSDTSLEGLQSRFEESRQLLLSEAHNAGEEKAEDRFQGLGCEKAEATPMRPRHERMYDGIAQHSEVSVLADEGEASHSGSICYESSDPDADDFSLTQILPPSLRRPTAASAGAVTAKRTVTQRLPHTFPMFSKGLQQHIIDSSPSRVG